MNSHPQRAMLARYYDDELPPAERMAVAQHLAACSGCQAELVALHGLSAALASVMPPAAAEMPAAEAFWHGLAPQLGAQEPPPPTGFSWAPGAFLLLLQAFLALFGAAATFAAALKMLARWASTAPALPWLRLWAESETLLETAATALAPFGGSTLPLIVGLSLGVLYLVWLAAWYTGRNVQPATLERRIV